MLTTIATAALLAAYAAAACLALLADLHRLQLGSYQLPAYMRAFCRKPSAALVHPIGAVVCAALVLIPSIDSTLRLGIIAAIFALLCIFKHLPRKAKKPLVFTTRLVRMFIIAALLAATPVVLYFFVEPDIGIWLIIGAYMLMPFIVILARLITAPIDYASRRSYTRDAQKQLESMPDLKIIGITGSFGKTSVKHYLGELLSERFETLITPGSFNTPMGVVRTIREHLRPTHEVFLCEMGARHVGDIKELCDIVHPHSGIITSIGEQHLETFHSFANIKRTKLELADAIKGAEGRVYINGDCVTSEDLAPYPNAVTYGIGKHNDYRVSDIRVSESGMAFNVHMPSGSAYGFETSILGEHSAVNILGAIAIATDLGIDASTLRIPVKRLRPVSHRLELRSLPDGTLIDDSFNSNPSGGRAALNTLAAFSGMRILITPGMVELGEREETLNREFGSHAAAACDRVYLVGRNRTRPIYSGLTDAGFAEENITVCDSFNEAIAQARTIATNGKRRVILIENDLPDNY